MPIVARHIHYNSLSQCFHVFKIVIFVEKKQVLLWKCTVCNNIGLKYSYFVIIITVRFNNTFLLMFMKRLAFTCMYATAS